MKVTPSVLRLPAKALVITFAMHKFHQQIAKALWMSLSLFIYGQVYKSLTTRIFFQWTTRIKRDSL
ncbi:MAG: hypothetical protein PHS49_00185 [Candidatus Gracilibacteria bacterium]|nr:hypothetical protein [Candidatus Gracilibacteria bacterium]